jgi:hypothetical protein
MFKNVLKFSALGAGIVLGGIGLLYILDSLQQKEQSSSQPPIPAVEVEKENALDPGGETPEETLTLFIEALKKGDVEHAARYFVAEAQDQWREDLAEMQAKNLVDDLLRDLEKRNVGQRDETLARYSLLSADGQTTLLVLVKQQNGKWKIQSL